MKKRIVTCAAIIIGLASGLIAQELPLLTEKHRYIRNPQQD